VQNVDYDERNPAMDDLSPDGRTAPVIREDLAMGQGEAIAAAACRHHVRWV
jgi:hypothetical protein